MAVLAAYSLLAILTVSSLFFDAAGSATAIPTLMVITNTLNISFASSIFSCHHSSFSILPKSSLVVGASITGSIGTEQEMKYSCQQNNHSMAWTSISKPRFKSRFVSSLLLCCVIFCFTTQTSALVLGKRTSCSGDCNGFNKDDAKDLGTVVGIVAAIISPLLLLGLLYWLSKCLRKRSNP